MVSLLAVDGWFRTTLSPGRACISVSMLLDEDWNRTALQPDERFHKLQQASTPAHLHVSQETPRFNAKAVTMRVSNYAASGCSWQAVRLTCLEHLLLSNTHRKDCVQVGHTGGASRGVLYQAWIATGILCVQQGLGDDAALHLQYFC